MHGIRATLGPAGEALRLALADRDLRDLSVAWLAAWAAKGAFLVANLVIAYGAGGPVAVGILGLATYLTPAVLAPFASVPVARWPAERVLLASHAIRGIGVLLAVAVIATGAPIEALYLAVALEAGAGSVTRPLHMALLPCLARTPGQLVAANVTSSAAEGVGTFLGPAVGGLLLAATGPLGTDLAVLALFAVAMAAVARVHAPRVGRGDASARSVAVGLLAGVRAIARLPGPRLVILGFGLQTFVRGLLTVLIVLAAIELLGMGEPGVGALSAAIGLGGVLGAGGSIALAGRDRLGTPFAVALAGWGMPIVLLAISGQPAIAIVAMLAVGLSNAVLDVAGFTLVQRTSPNERRIAVLGLVDGVASLAPALGGVAAPVLIAWLGTRGAIVATAAILPLAAVAMWPALRRIDEGGAHLADRAASIRRVPLFGLLSLASVEHLAARLEPVRFERGAWLMREGDPGDTYVIVEHGHVEISQGGRVIGSEGPGAGVGEIALLRDVPRTASVRAMDDVGGYTLDRASFLEAVTGHAASQSLAASLAQRRLAADASA